MDKCKKKVLLFHHCDDWGGGSISLLTISKMLNSKYRVIVYLPHLNTKLGDSFRKEGIIVKAIEDNVGIINAYSGSPNTLSISFARYYAKILLYTRPQIKDILKKEEPDIVIVNSMTLSWLGKDIKKIGAKSICFVRETASNALGMKLIYYNLNHYFDGISFISEYDKNIFNSKAKIQRVIPDSMISSIKEFYLPREEVNKRLKISPDKFNVLFVGGTNNYPKGWSVIRDAMFFLDKYNIQLLVAGYANETEKVSKDNIIFLGVCTNMMEIYSASDVLVFPSTAPHQARPVYEAGFMGVPVIISDFEQTKEYVRNKVNGLTFKAGDSKELAKCILKLFSDLKLCKDLGKNNRKETFENHSYDECNNKLQIFMRDIISG